MLYAHIVLQMKQSFILLSCKDTELLRTDLVDCGPNVRGVKVHYTRKCCAPGWLMFEILDGSYHGDRSNRSCFVLPIFQSGLPHFLHA